MPFLHLPLFQMNKLMSRIKVIVIVAFILLIKTTSGQQAYFKSMLSGKAIDNTKIHCFFQDQNNLIWLGTENGLYSYDGINVSKFMLSDTSRISITSIYENAIGELWIGSNTGAIYKIDKSNSPEIIYFRKLTSVKINNIIEDQKGVLWFASYGDGIYYMKEDTMNHLNTGSGLADDYIYTLILDQNNSIWAGTDNGINICNFENDQLNISHLSVEDGLPDFIVQSLESDDKGNIWVGMHDHGICCYSLSGQEFLIPEGMTKWNHGPVENILSVDQQLWIATRGNGIFNYDMKQHIIQPHIPLNNLNPGKIHSIADDNEGNIWFVSQNDLIMTKARQIIHYTGANDILFTNIHAIVSDSEDNIWFANDKGLFKFNPYSNNIIDTIKQFPLNVDISRQKIMCLYEDKYGFMWIGTFGSGIIRLNPEDGSYINITETDGLINGNVLSVSGSETQIWFATLGGASKCELLDDCSDLKYSPEFQNYSYNDGLINSFIYDVFVDSKQRVWFATDGNGLIVFEDNEFKNITERDGLNNAVIYSIAEDNAGKIWFNSLNEGLFSYHNGQLQNHQETIDLSVSAVIFNPANEMIILHTKGIDIYNLNSDEVHNFREQSGIVPIEPDLNTLTVDSRGNVWAGTNLGIIRYSGIIGIQTKKPLTKITSVKVFLEKINLLSDHKFSHDQNHFTFEFQGLWYQQPDDVKYQIKLQGHDLDWINDANNTVIYSSLSPGEYEFMVRSAINNNFKNAEIKTYSFQILKPFWMNTWFYLLIVAILIISVLFIIRIREQKLKRKQEILHERIRFQFENLRSQINPHFLFNSFSTLIALIDTNKETAIEYVSELSQLFRNVLEFQDKDVISLKEEFKIIENYIKIHKKRHGSSLHFEIREHPVFNTIKLPPMTLQLLIENAIKHNIVSKSKPLFISIYYHEEKKLLIVENNLQIKKEKIISTGIGLTNVTERYKLLTEKKIQIEEEPGVFRIGLPLID